MTIGMVHLPRMDDCEGLPTPQRVPDPFPITGPTVWPTMTDVAWQDPATVQRIAHPSIHVRPQPGCDLCPPTVCPCGVAACPDVFDHARTYAGAEATVLESAQVPA